MQELHTGPKNRYVFSYAGISYVEPSLQDKKRGIDHQQTMYVYADTHRAQSGAVCADVQITDVAAFRDAMYALMQVVYLGFPHKPVSPGDPLVYERTERNRAAAKKFFYDGMKKYDAQAWVVMDPVLTITDNGMLFEVVDKRGIQLASFFLKSSAYTGKVGLGSAHVEVGEDFLESLLLINTNASLRLCIGTDLQQPRDNNGEVYTGYVYQDSSIVISKDFCYPDEWERCVLQFLASSTLENTKFTMKRIDMFNLLQYLRLHADPKKDAGEGTPEEGAEAVSKVKTALQFIVVQNKQPEIRLEPWNHSIVCTASPYTGNKSGIMGYSNRRDLSRLEALLPHVDDIAVTIVGEAQPVFWSLQGKSFVYTFATMGFKPSNWAPGLQLDQRMRRDTPNNAQYEKVQEYLEQHANGATANDISSALGVLLSDVQDALLRLIQHGLVAPAFDGVYRYRVLLPGLDVQRSNVVFRNGQERKAYIAVSQGRVQKKITVKPTGEIDFALEKRTRDFQTIVQKGVEVTQAVYQFSSDPSTVTEEKKSFQTEEPVYTPKLQLNVAGATRKPGCSCAYMLAKEKNAPQCSHIQALWIQHCQDQMNIASTSVVSLAQQMLIKTAVSEEVYRISVRGKRVIEEWGDCTAITSNTGKRQVILFQEQEKASDAFFARVAQLEQNGFIKLG